MNIFIFAMFAVSGVAAFSPFQMPNGIFGNYPVRKDDTSAAGRIFFQKQKTITSVTAVTVTSTVKSYSTCYCSVTPLTPCPTNRKKKQMPWILTEPYVVQPLTFQISGSQPVLTHDFNPYPWVPLYNFTNDRADIETFPQNPVANPQWPLHLVSYERAQVLPVEYRLQTNENRYSESFLKSIPKHYAPERKKRPEDFGVYSGTEVESSLSQNAADTEGRSFTFNINAVVVSTFTVTSYVSTLAGTQQLNVECLASGANFPAPTCTNTCPKLILDLCKGLGNEFCTTGVAKGVCDSRTGTCKCDTGFQVITSGKCGVCLMNAECLESADAVAVCSAGVCECTKGTLLTKGKCFGCSDDASCKGTATGTAGTDYLCTTATAICSCTGATSTLSKITGKCELP